MDFLEPWYAVPSDMRAALEKQLAAELATDDQLYGHRAIAIARRGDQDDVLFEFAGIGFAVVHLGWGKERWRPRRKIYPSLKEFEPVMKQDHQDFTCPFKW